MTTQRSKGAKSKARKSKQLSLSKKTLKDLAPRKGGAEALKGGRLCNVYMTTSF